MAKLVMNELIGVSGVNATLSSNLQRMRSEGKGTDHLDDTARELIAAMREPVTRPAILAVICAVLNESFASNGRLFYADGNGSITYQFISTDVARGVLSGALRASVNCSE